MRSLAAAATLAVILASAAAIGGGQPSQQSDSVWNRRPPGAGDYRIVMEVSGREELALYLDVPPNPEDLAAICTARRDAVQVAIRSTERRLASLTSKPESQQEWREIAWTYKSLGQLRAHEGQMARAIEHFESAYRILTTHRSADNERRAARSYLEAVLGVAHLRRGELENCVHGHAAASCIFPIREAGRHREPSGSQNAIRWFTRCLAENPDDLDIRWLLNVAYMTLGQYPDAVPPKYLMPPDALNSRENPGLFVDVAPGVGLGGVGRAGGAVVDDLDNDGLLDVVVSSVDSCAPLRYFRHQPDGTFRDATADAGLSGALGGINVTETDYNNDGRLDLFVMRGGWEFAMRNSLLRGNADGTFTDVTRDSGLSSARHRTHTAAWADFDNDGWIDVFVGHEETASSLFRNLGNGTFVDVGPSAGVARTAFTKGAAWGDYDGDGYPDLYVSNYGGENFLYHNERNGTFTERAKALGVEKPIMSFPVWFFDYDNDGRLDLFVASFVPSLTEVVKGFLGLPRQAETLKLYRNRGTGTSGESNRGVGAPGEDNDGFEDVTTSARLDRVVPTMGANFGDIDNDGYLDIYLGTGAPSYAAIMPNVLFRNHAGRYFVDVTTATGTGHLQKGHGVAFADIDGDGDLDIFENIGGFVPGDAYNRALFQNPGNGNHWIRVKLVGVKTNRAAIGAKIRIELEDGGIRYREVTTGGSFGASPLAQHIGLGKADRVKTLEIRWPATNTHQTFRDVPADREILIKEFDKAIGGRR